MRDTAPAPSSRRPIDRFFALARSRSVTLALAWLIVQGFVFASDFPAARADERARTTTPWSRASLERLEKAGVPRAPLERALAALACARSRGLVEATTLTLIDYSRPSTDRRLWVIDAASGRVRFHEFVAHGRGSGEDRASLFSNKDGSHQSSLGLFRTAETYQGMHGYSLRLDGLEPGVNDRARKRAIVMHGADYVTAPFIEEHGRLGRSWGCPALDPAINEQLIDTIRGGTAVFAYYPDSGWLDDSPYQSCETRTASR